ncbi:Putative amidohydrolase [Idiomarina sp. A28L]|uniref:carbon-nitrogen hydrolase family protein n=1 Tax=Idiomarina sp. A28L TaxID=1036674 RepID=UPI000213883A|nr:carbon-nitrogen hydrolase family protein [Idiomarina sp. A28L]EGN74887.1 Putative amidohydrolase [Idiomarina sp. A28L]
MSNANISPLITLLQWTSRSDWEANKAYLLKAFEEVKASNAAACTSGPHLVILPEAFARFGAGEAAQGKFAEELEHGPVQDFIADCCRRFNFWILAGTIAVRGGERYAAASLLFNADGELAARYDKIHLFDASVNDNTKSYRESAFTKPGNKLVVVETPFGKIGLAVCYDLRFPEMFRALRKMGAQLITLPSAFTKVTGEAHWQPLLQARAIENQVYLLAPNQTGTHDDGRETWGCSMVVDPWGKIVATLGSEPGFISFTPNFEELEQLRGRMPVQQHNQFEVTFLND